MTNGARIREAKKADAKAIAEVLNVQFRCGRYSRGFLRRYRNTEKKILKDMDKCDYFVIGDAPSEVSGVISLLLMRGTCKIDDLAVREDQQHKGLGTRLVLFAEKYARKKKCHKIWCTSSKELKASGFYRKLGFGLEGCLRRHFDMKDILYFGKLL